MRDVLTNRKLYRIGRSVTDQCYLCENNEETIEHLYWECTNIKRLWERLKILLYKRLEYNIPMAASVMLFGILPYGTQEDLPPTAAFYC